MSSCSAHDPSTHIRRIQAAAPHVPVILMAAKEDIEVAVRLVREGAQDFLIAPEIDAAPLAHALGTAIERQRLLSAARAATGEDPFTGLPNRKAFLALGERDRRMAEKLGCRWMLVLTEPTNLGTSTHNRGAVISSCWKLRNKSGASPVQRISSPASVIFALAWAFSMRPRRERWKRRCRASSPCVAKKASANTASRWAPRSSTAQTLFRSKP